MKLSTKQKEEIRDLYSFGHFMNTVLTRKQDAAGNPLSDDEVMFLIEAEDNLDLFSNYETTCVPCELCGSHGTVSVDIGDKTFVVKEW